MDFKEVASIQSFICPSCNSKMQPISSHCPICGAIIEIVVNKKNQYVTNAVMFVLLIFYGLFVYCGGMTWVKTFDSKLTRIATLLGPMILFLPFSLIYQKKGMSIKLSREEDVIAKIQKNKRTRKSFYFIWIIVGIAMRLMFLSVSIFINEKPFDLLNFIPSLLIFILVGSGLAELLYRLAGNEIDSSVLMLKSRTITDDESIRDKRKQSLKKINKRSWTLSVLMILSVVLAFLVINLMTNRLGHQLDAILNGRTLITISILIFMSFVIFSYFIWKKIFKTKFLSEFQEYAHNGVLNMSFFVILLYLAITIFLLILMASVYINSSISESSLVTLESSVVDSYSCNGKTCYMVKYAEGDILYCQCPNSTCTSKNESSLVTLKIGKGLLGIDWLESAEYKGQITTLPQVKKSRNNCMKNNF